MRKHNNNYIMISKNVSGIYAGGLRSYASGGRIAAGGGLFAGGPFAAGLIAGGLFASGLNAAPLSVCTLHNSIHYLEIVSHCGTFVLP